MYYAFKPNPKQLVTNKAHSLWGRSAKVEVNGTRPNPAECTRLGIPVGCYYVECHVNGSIHGRASSKDWRKAYNLLVIELEKFFENSLHQTQAV
jgi:hypothetical protein